MFDEGWPKPKGNSKGLITIGGEYPRIGAYGTLDEWRKLAGYLYEEGKVKKDVGTWTADETEGYTYIIGALGKRGKPHLYIRYHVAFGPSENSKGRLSAPTKKNTDGLERAYKVVSRPTFNKHFKETYGIKE